MKTTLALISLVCAIGTSSAARAESPMALLKHSNDDVRQILKQQQGGAASTAQKERVKQIVNGFLDYDELAKRSLAAYWEKTPPAERTEFVRVFRELIERNYVKQLRSNVDYDIKYGDEEIHGAEATVHSTVTSSRNGRSADTTIDYKLAARGRGWAVYDVITDDVSLLRNYRSQFAKIIEKDGFSALIAKMKKRLAETTE
jgi:phospholipid transport system substrate-binding protein